MWKHLRCLSNTACTCHAAQIMRDHAPGDARPRNVIEFDYVYRTPTGVSRQHRAAAVIQRAWRAYRAAKRMAANPGRRDA
jgi:hypothetical protein